MKYLLYAFLLLSLSACAVNVKKVEVDSLSVEKSISSKIPLDSELSIYIPLDEKDKVYTLNYYNSYDFPIGKLLENSSKKIAEKYFSNVADYSELSPLHFLLKLESTANIGVGFGTYTAKVKATLSNSNGEIIDKREVEGTTLAMKVNEENALYNAYAKAVAEYFNQVIKEKESEILKFTASHQPKLLEFNSDSLKKEIKVKSVGSAFGINNQGQLITNKHVIENCLLVNVKNGEELYKANLVASDDNLDIALLSSPLSPQSYAKFDAYKSNGRLGEDILIIGYPLSGGKNASPTLTTGNISALTGLGKTQLFQVTAPVQLGNSGGPVLNKRGTIQGVVQSKLNTLLFAQLTGDITQNVNFAIKNSNIHDFLNDHSVDFSIIENDSSEILNTSDIAEEAIKYTYQVLCLG